MKKFLASILICISLVICIPERLRNADLPDTYVAVFTSEEFVSEWADYSPDLKYVYKSWSDFPKFLDRAKKNAGHKKLVIDLDIHGGFDGFYVSFKTIKTVKIDLFNNTCLYIPFETYDYERASMGYIYTELEKRFKNRKNLTVLCEACYPGNNYYTIRKNYKDIYSNEFDSVNYSYYPDIPIYCLGSGVQNPDITMYLQYRYNLRKWWEDIRKYETAIPLVLDSYTQEIHTQEILEFDSLLRENLN